MKKAQLLLPLALLVSQCRSASGFVKAPDGSEDGYVFYKGIRRFLSDGTEIEPLVNSVLINGEPYDIGSEGKRQRIVSIRKNRDVIDCYFPYEETSGYYCFSYDYPSGKTTEPKRVIGDPSAIASFRFPGTRDYQCWWQQEGGSFIGGILRDGISYSAEDAEEILHVSKRGEYELFIDRQGIDGQQTWTFYLAYRPFSTVDGTPALGDRTLLLESDRIHFVELDPSSSNRFFFTDGEEPKWYRFNEETLELAEVGSYERDRYRFLRLHYERKKSSGYASGDPTSTRYLLEEGAKTFLKDLRDPSYLLDVTEKVPKLGNLFEAGYSEDIGLLYFANYGESCYGDAYLESEGRWVGADIMNRRKDGNGKLLRWNFSYPYLKTSHFTFRVNVDNQYRYLDLNAKITSQLIRAKAGTEDFYWTQCDRFAPDISDYTFEPPFLYDYVDTKGDEILEIGPSLSPLMNPPLATP